MSSALLVDNHVMLGFGFGSELDGHVSVERWDSVRLSLDSMTVLSVERWDSVRLSLNSSPTLESNPLPHPDPDYIDCNSTLEPNPCPNPCPKITGNTLTSQDCFAMELSADKVGHRSRKFWSELKTNSDADPTFRQGPAVSAISERMRS